MARHRLGGRLAVRRAPAAREARIPPGQYEERGFPVLSAGPTPHTPLAKWDFTLRGVDGKTASWTWDEFNALPHETITRDIHCVTKWSKLDTVWEGISVDTLIAEAAKRGVATAPFIVDQHLYTATSGANGARVEAFGDPEDFNNGIGQVGGQLTAAARAGVGREPVPGARHQLGCRVADEGVEGEGDALLLLRQPVDGGQHVLLPVGPPGLGPQLGGPLPDRGPLPGRQPVGAPLVAHRTGRSAKARF